MMERQTKTAIATARTPEAQTQLMVVSHIQTLKYLYDTGVAHATPFFMEMI